MHFYSRTMKTLLLAKGFENISSFSHFLFPIHAIDFDFFTFLNSVLTFSLCQPLTLNVKTFVQCVLFSHLDSLDAATASLHLLTILPGLQLGQVIKLGVRDGPSLDGRHHLQRGNTFTKIERNTWFCTCKMT